MIKIWFISVLFFLVNIESYSQEKNDTLFFFSRFSYLMKSIEVIDSCNGTIIKLNSDDGRLLTPKELIINEQTKVLKVIIRYNFFLKKVIGYVYTDSIKTKFIYIWYHQKKVEFQYCKFIVGRI